MASKDTRNWDGRFRIAKFQFSQLSWASGVTSSKTAELNVNVTIERIDVIVSNATNAITMSIKMTDENSATCVDTIATISENATSTYLASKATPDFPACPVNNTLTLTVTPSGDPGTSGVTADVIIYGY